MTMQHRIPDADEAAAPAAATAALPARPASSSPTYGTASTTSSSSLSAKSKNGTSHLHKHLNTGDCKRPSVCSSSTAAGDQDEEAAIVEEEEEEEGFVESIANVYDQLDAEGLVFIESSNDVPLLPQAAKSTSRRFFEKSRERLARRPLVLFHRPVSKDDVSGSRTRKESMSSSTEDYY